jgi:hypothetical protein
VTGATAHDGRVNGLTYTLLFNEALYYRTKLDHFLINPNQIRSYGIDFCDNPFDRERGLIIDVNEELKIPMHSSGTKVQFTTRTQTEAELRDCPRIIMTSPHPWNPNEVVLSEAVSAPVESIPTSRISHISEMGTIRHYEYTDPTSDESLLHSINPCLTNLREQLISR